MYTPKPRPLMAMPTRKPSKSVAAAITNSAKPYTIDAARTKTFRRPVRSDSRPPTREASDDEDGLGERAEEDLLRDVVLGAAELVQQVVGLVGDEEGVGQDEQEAAGEGPGEVGALAGVDVEGGRELPQRPRRLVRRGEPAVVEDHREQQDEEPADRARREEHRELVAGEQLDQERAAHRRDRQADARGRRRPCRAGRRGPGPAAPPPARRAAR